MTRSVIAQSPEHRTKYAYDGSWNLAWRTNNALVQEFKTNPLNELTNVACTGTLTVAGNVTIPSASVTVSGTGLSSTQLTPYADGSWAVAGAAPGAGQSTYTAVAEDSYSRRDTNTVSVTLPSALTLAHDLNGNLTNDSRRVFQYDFENQLTNVYVSGEWRSEFKYDAFGRRKIRREYKWNTSSWLQTNEVRYIYDGLLVVQERHYVPVAGTLIPQQTVTYTRGIDLGGTFQGAGGIGGLLARSESSLPTPGSTPHAYYHSDGNGNVTFLVATNGSLAAAYAYDPYGSISATEGPLAEANLNRFSSKEYHQGSGLVYYLYRYYEPKLQRWTSRDPVEETGGVNLFGFTGNTPTLAVDLLGLRPLTSQEKSILDCLLQPVVTIDPKTDKGAGKKLEQAMKDLRKRLMEEIDKLPTGAPTPNNIKVQMEALGMFKDPPPALNKEAAGPQCSPFVRDALKKAGLDFKKSPNAAAFASGDLNRFEKDYGLKLSQSSSPTPGNIFAGGDGASQGSFQGHVGIYLGFGIYISQSLLTEAPEAVSTAGNLIKIRPVEQMSHHYPFTRYTHY